MLWRYDLARYISIPTLLTRSITLLIVKTYYRLVLTEFATPTILDGLCSSEFNSTSLDVHALVHRVRSGRNTRDSGGCRYTDRDNFGWAIVVAPSEPQYNTMYPDSVAILLSIARHWSYQLLHRLAKNRERHRSPSSANCKATHWDGTRIYYRTHCVLIWIVIVCFYDERCHTYIAYSSHLNHLLCPLSPIPPRRLHLTKRSSSIFYIAHPSNYYESKHLYPRQVVNIRI